MLDLASAQRFLDAIVDTFQGKERFLVQAHNNPDPDSIASCMAVRYLIQRYTGRDAVIAFGGVVGRSENRAMVRQLKIAMVPGSLVDYSKYDFTAVCDTQPGTNYTSFPDGFVPTVVIDHHPEREETKRSAVRIVEPGYGATSTIMGQLLMARDIPVPTDVATALYYGIKSETQDLCRDTSPIDEEVYRKLGEFADRKLVARIETEKVPREYFRELRSTITAAQIYEDVIVADLVAVRVPDLVAEMADFLLRHEGMRWTCVMGAYQDTLYLSLRNADDDGDAGDTILKMMDGMGSCGGHPSMAGGQVAFTGLDEEQRKAAKDTLIERFLTDVGASASEPSPLVPPDDPVD